MKILYFAIVTFIISVHLCQGQSVKINEIMAWNTSVIKDSAGNYHPWVELYNPGPGTVNLQGYFLSDHSYDPLRWEFPDVVIPSGGFKIVFISGRKVGATYELHCDISLTSTKESWNGIYLSDPSGKLIDQVSYVSTEVNTSYGRSPDGNLIFAYFAIPTPEFSNTSAPFAGALPAPVLSHMAGFYDRSFNLVIASSDPSSEVRYTLDGSDPTLSSPIYTEPLLINDKTNDPNNLSLIQSTFNPNWMTPSVNVEKYSVVKARAYKDGHLPGEVITSTYFVNNNIKSRFKMPVISLSTDSWNFFDYNNGIYVPGKVYADYSAAHPNEPVSGTTPANFTQRGEDWNRQSQVEFFESSGVLGFSQPIAVDIHGDYSRFNRQHALNLKGGKGFDDPNKIDYPIFPGLVQRSGIDGQKSKYLVSKDITKFKLIMLSNNGSDWGYTMFRDALAQNLFAHRNLSTQAYRPCVLFLNGEYWGIHGLREKFDQDYLESHYGVLKTNSTILYNEGALYEGDPAAVEEYNDLVSYISSNDMSLASNYSYAKTKMDMENYAEFYAAEIYLNNVDWPGSNIRFWKSNNPYNPNSEYGHDGRWRWGLQDLDLTMGSDQPGGDYAFNSLLKATTAGGTEWPNPDWSTVVFRNLLKNSDFKNMFINLMADHMNSTLKPSRVMTGVDQFKVHIEPEMPAHIARWNAPVSMTDWYDNLDILNQFAINRPKYQIMHMMQYFGISDTVHINLDVSGEGQGKIRINYIDIDKDLPGINPNIYPWNGTYYKNIPVTLNAIAYPGHKFVKWEGTVNSTDAIITLDNIEDTNLRAIFETNSPFEPNSGNVNLYPNPATGSLNVEFTDDNQGDIYLFVYDRLGKEYYSGGVSKLGKTVVDQIDLEGFSKGLYILRVKSSTGKLYKKKFVVDK